MMAAVKSFLLLTMLAVASAQIPSLGWCPDYQAMPNFNLNRFLGTWHEAERYFTITELGSRCVTTSYEKLADGRIIVHNEIKSALTGVKRVLDGQLQHVGRDGEGKLAVKYLSLPVPYDTQYTILDTDYDTFAVMWSCSGIGPVHTQNAWVMTRDRLAPGIVLQRAYGVLDKFKISRAFFVKTGQDDCTIQTAPIDVIDPVQPAPVAAPVAPAAAAVVKSNSEAVNEPIVEDAPKEVEKEEAVPEIKVDPDVKPEEPIPQVKSPLPVAELIITNAEKVAESAVVEQNENVVDNSNPEIPAVKAIEPVNPEPENPPKPAEAPVESVQAEQIIKSVVNEIANEEPSKTIVEQSDPIPVEQKPEEKKA